MKKSGVKHKTEQLRFQSPTHFIILSKLSRTCKRIITGGHEGIELGDRPHLQLLRRLDEALFNLEPEELVACV